MTLKYYFFNFMFRIVVNKAYSNILKIKKKHNYDEFENKREK